MKVYVFASPDGEAFGLTLFEDARNLPRYDPPKTWQLREVVSLFEPDLARFSAHPERTASNLLVRGFDVVRRSATILQFPTPRPSI